MVTMCGPIGCEVIMSILDSVFSQVFRSVIGDVDWLPNSLFAQAEPGAWYDPSNLTTLFQDSAGTTPVTSAGQTVGLMLDKSGRGNHATQATLAQRPTYQIDSTGRPYLSFDGVDDGMVTGTITPGTNKVQVFSGVRKLSDALRGVVAEMSATIAGNAGVFTLITSSSSGPNYTFSSKGTVQTDNIGSTYAAPITNVVSALGDISGPSSLVRVNGSQVGSVLTTQGTGNYLAYPLYIGRRGGSSLPFNGRIYSLIVRFGAPLTIGQITSTENYVNSKTGAY